MLLPVFAVMESGPFMTKFVIVALFILVMSTVLKILKQPQVVIYILTGILLGPHLGGVFVETEIITSLGSVGLILLLFFVGMEISIHKLITNWKISVIGTIIQVSLSILIVTAIGLYFGWLTERIITLGFVISLSSTSVVIKMLQERNELDTKIGQNALGILLVQDVLIVPMMITLNYLGGDVPETSEVILQIVGGILIIGLVAYVIKKGEIVLPFSRYIEDDHELQVFFSFAICFGFAALTGVFGLSTALGAFVAGILVSSTRATTWFHDSLSSMRIFFVALFFLSVGMMIDLQFIFEHWVVILLLVLAVFLVNNIINSAIFHFFGETWRESFYTGALLSQIGEFSFVIGALAFQHQAITDFGYQLIISIISLTLLMSPIWISISNLIMRGQTIAQEKLKNIKLDL